MADLDEAFQKLSNPNKTFGNIEYFFTQRKVNEDQAYVNKHLDRVNKQISVIYNFLAINIPNIIIDDITSGFDIEIFGDSGYHYKAYIPNYSGKMPHLLIPLEGDKKIFINILPKLETKIKENYKYGSENIVFNKNYIAFIEVPKRYQTNDNTNQQKMDVDNILNIDDVDINDD